MQIINTTDGQYIGFQLSELEIGDSYTFPGSFVFVCQSKTIAPEYITYSNPNYIITVRRT